MSSILVSVALALAGAPAPQDHSNHAGHAAPVTPAVSAPAAGPTAITAQFTLDTPIATLMADPRSKAAVDAAVPGVAGHPSYETFKGMSFNQLAPMAPDRLTPDVLGKIKAGLDAIK